MTNEVQVRINTIEKVKRFSNITNEFNNEIEVLCGRYIIDGKSIMALFSINLLEPLTVRILTDDEEEIETFNRVMEDFKYESESK